MAVSRLTTWLAGQVLTAAALNSEFDNLTGGGISLITPFTGSADVNAFDLTNIDETHFTNAAANASAAGRLRRNAANLTWHDGTNVLTLSSVLLALTAGDITGTDEVAFTDAAANASAAGRLRRNAANLTWHDGTNVLTLSSVLLALTAGDITGTDEVAFTDAAANASAAGRLRRNATVLSWHNGTSVGQVLLAQIAPVNNEAIVPAAVSGTPAQHGLFRENVVKGWVKCGVAADINDSFNVASITDTGTGVVTVTWDRDFATVQYVVNITLSAIAALVTNVSNQAAGTVDVESRNTSFTLSDPVTYFVSAIGDQ